MSYSIPASNRGLPLNVTARNPNPTYKPNVATTVTGPRNAALQKELPAMSTMVVYGHAKPPRATLPINRGVLQTQAGVRPSGPLSGVRISQRVLTGVRLGAGATTSPYGAQVRTSTRVL